MTGQATPLRLCIADDHQMFVEAMQLLLDASPQVNVISVARTGEDLLADIFALLPDIAIVDISMEGPGFRAIAQKALTLDAPPKLVALTMHLDRDLANRAIASGFSAYVVKDAAVAELLTAIQAASRGETFISKSVLALETMVPNDSEHLTPREVSCLSGAERGQTNRDIADDLGISERTVKFHFENIFRKLGAKSRGEAVARGRRLKLI